MLMNESEYLNIVESVKSEIKLAQYKAALNVNRKLIMLYPESVKLSKLQNDAQAPKRQQPKHYSC